jgi:hypothetical protein
MVAIVQAVKQPEVQYSTQPMNHTTVCSNGQNSVTIFPYLREMKSTKDKDTGEWSDWTPTGSCSQSVQVTITPVPGNKEATLPAFTGDISHQAESVICRAYYSIPVP